MNNMQLALFDYAALDPETRIVAQQLASEMHSIGRRMVQDIIEFGAKATKARDLLRHNKSGGFEAWLEHEGFKRQFTYNCIAAYDEFGNLPNFGKLDIAISAVYLLSAPSTPPLARLEAIGRAESGETITYTQARELVSTYKPSEAPALQYVDDEDDLPESRDIDPVTGEIFTDDDTEDVPFETSPKPQNGQPVMPQKPTYHAGNRSIGDQFHSKLIWNYQRLDLSEFDHFTIGYSQRSWEQFNELLEVAGVTVLMDVRRNAVSQYKPEFSKQSLQLACEAENLIYIHAPELGVDFEDRAELSETHDYNTLFDTYEQRLTPSGIYEAINRRVPMADQRIAFMCVEIDPCTCHRNRIAKALQEYKALTTFDL